MVEKVQKGFDIQIAVMVSLKPTLRVKSAFFIQQLQSKKVPLYFKMATILDSTDRH